MKNRTIHRMVLALGVGAALLGSLAARPAHAAVGDFAGVWANADPNTQHIVRFTVVPFQSGPVLSVEGKCVPTPCPWGSTPLLTYGNNVSDSDCHFGTAAYNFGFANAAMTFQLLDAKTMLVQTYTQFLDHSGRQNYHTMEMFHKLPIIIDPAPGF